MARHQVMKLLCVIVLLAHHGLATKTVEDTRPSLPAARTAPRAASASTGSTARQARDGHRRDYRCLNCPNADERARFIDIPPSYSDYSHPPSYRQAPLPYATRDDRVSDRNWYYPSDYADDRYPAYYVSAAEQQPQRPSHTPDYSAGSRYDDRYDDRYAGYGRYEDRYYGTKPSGYLPVAGAAVSDTRYQYGNDYRGNGYDNRDAQYAMRSGVDQYYREPDYDRYSYHHHSASVQSNRDYGRDNGRDYGRDNGRDYGRDTGRDYPRDYVPPRSYPRDYVRDYAPAREYGSATRYAPVPETYTYRGGSNAAGDYYDTASYAGGNRLGYDNRNFRPWDESYRGTSGFDNSGRGYYFASRLYGNSLPAPPPPPSSLSTQHDSKPYRVSSHYYIPNSPASPSSSSSSSSSSGQSPVSSSPSSSTSSSSSSLSPTSTDPHKASGGSSSSAGVSSYDNGGGMKNGGGGGDGGSRYGDWNRDRPDKEAQSTRYGSGSNSARYLRPLAGSYLFERDDAQQPAAAATVNGADNLQQPMAERLTMQPTTPEAAQPSAATSAATTTLSSTSATSTMTSAAAGLVASTAAVTGTQPSEADTTASEVASLVAASSTVAVADEPSGTSTLVADERL